MTKLKILQVINNLGSGGAERLLADYVSQNALLDNNVENDILTLNNNSSIFSEEISKNGVKIINLNCSSIYSLNNIFKLRKIINTNEYDICHVHLFPSQYWVVLAYLISNKRNKMKLITTEHNTYNRRRDIYFFKFIDRFIYSNFDKIISISEDTQTSLKRWLNFDEKNKNVFNIISNGVDTKKFKLATRITKSDLIPNADINTIIIVMVARFTEQKDHKTLVNALKFLPDNYHLILVGTGEKEEKLKEYVKLADVSERVHFFGVRKDVENILKSSDVMVLSSKWEGFGLVAVEGMASGLPVIVSNVQGLNTVVDDSDLQFEYGDFQELAQKIINLENKELYKEKLEYSQKQAEKFNLDAYINNINELYKHYERGI